VNQSSKERNLGDTTARFAACSIKGSYGNDDADDDEDEGEWTVGEEEEDEEEDEGEVKAETEGDDDDDEEEEEGGSGVEKPYSPASKFRTIVVVAPPLATTDDSDEAWPDA
jgi:hypothetical protein